MAIESVGSKAIDIYLADLLVAEIENVDLSIFATCKNTK